jgi:hypothetical protein
LAIARNANGKKAPSLDRGKFSYNRKMETEKEKETLSRIIGWREWVSLNELGLDALKAKIDTGAKTSSLHAFDIKLLPKQEGKKRYVSFKVNPLQEESSVVIKCKAPLVDKRVVTDSGGHREERFVIRTMVTMGTVKKKIELTLTNRETMKFRMLIGRTALDDFYIDPSQSFLLGKTLKQKRYLKDVKELEDGAG